MNTGIKTIIRIRALTTEDLSEEIEEIEGINLIEKDGKKGMVNVGEEEVGEAGTAEASGKDSKIARDSMTEIRREKIEIHNPRRAFGMRKSKKIKDKIRKRTTTTARTMD